MSLELSSSSIVCSKCGTAYGKRSGNFYRCHGQAYKGIGYMTTCKKCVDQAFEQYLAASADTMMAMRQVCRKFDLYWNYNAYDYVFKRNVTKNIVSAYLQKLSNATYIGKSYDDTLMADGTIWDFSTEEERSKHDISQDITSESYIDVPSDGKEEAEDISIPDEIIDFWGPSYTPDMYLELDKRYRYWKNKLKYTEDDELDAGIEALIRQICGLEIDINKERSEGKTPDKLVSTLNSLIGSAQLKPDQKKDDITKADANTPFGVWIRRWEDERPIPEVDPSLKDVDGIVKYITTWFLGHLAKMLGVKKAEVKLYEQEIERLRVERPEYSEEDDEELITDIFSDATYGIDSGGEADAEGT